MKIYIIRHGETDWNVKKMWQGTTDIPLNEKGVLQANQVAKRLENVNFERIFSSPLIRAKATAEAVGKIKNLDVCVKRDLREVELGEWEGLTHTEVVSKYPDTFTVWEKGLDTGEIGFGIENFNDLQERAYKVLLEICEEAKGDTLIVSHGAWIIGLVCKILHISLEYRKDVPVGNTGITIIEYSNSKFLVKTLNDVAHI